MRQLRAPFPRTAFGRDLNRPPSERRRMTLEPIPPHGPAHGLGANEPARLLLVVGDPLQRRMFRMVLASPHLSVCEVESGEAAIDLLAFRRFDLVLLDVTLPRMNGPETLAWLRRGPAQWRDTPVMALVAPEDERWVGPMRAIGLDDWTPKPVDRSNVSARIARILPALPNASG